MDNLVSKVSFGGLLHLAKDLAEIFSGVYRSEYKLDFNDITMIELTKSLSSPLYLTTVLFHFEGPVLYVA
jgi:hypothetical protein